MRYLLWYFIYKLHTNGMLINHFIAMNTSKNWNICEKCFFKVPKAENIYLEILKLFPYGLSHWLTLKLFASEIFLFLSRKPFYSDLSQ